MRTYSGLPSRSLFARNRKPLVFNQSILSIKYANLFALSSSRFNRFHLEFVAPRAAWIRRSDDAPINPLRSRRSLPLAAKRSRYAPCHGTVVAAFAPKAPRIAIRERVPGTPLDTQLRKIDPPGSFAADPFVRMQLI